MRRLLNRQCDHLIASKRKIEIGWCDVCSTAVQLPCRACWLKSFVSKFDRPQFPIATEATKRLTESVAILNLPERLLDALSAGGIFTVNDLVHRNRKDLEQLPGLSNYSVAKIVDSLAEFASVTT